MPSGECWLFALKVKVIVVMGSRRYQSPCNVLLQSYILSWFGLYIQTWLKTIRYVHRPFRGLFSTGRVYLSTESLLRVIMYVRKPRHKWFWVTPLPFIYYFPINKKSWTRKNCNNYRSTNIISVSHLKQKIRILNKFFPCFWGSLIFAWHTPKAKCKRFDIFFCNSWPPLQRIKTQANASN